MSKIPVRHILVPVLLATAGCAMMLAAFLFFLPDILSSGTVQGMIRKTLSTSLNRRVVWSELTLSRSDGLSLSGLSLGDGPAPLLKTDIDQIIVTPSVGRGVDGRFGIDLLVRVRNARVSLAPAQPKPAPPPAGDPLTRLAASIQDLQRQELALPVDLRVKVEVAPLRLAYHAPAPGKPVLLQDFSFDLSMPSLLTRPVSADLHGRVSLDGRELGKVGLTAKVSDIVAKDRRLRISSAVFDVAASVPGTNLTLSGGLRQADGFAARCSIRLPQLIALVRPLAASRLPQLDGSVELALRAKAEANNDLRAELAIDGTGVAVSGGVLAARCVGPLDVRLKQSVATDHIRQRVEFPGGSLAVPTLLEASWSAAVDKPAAPERSLEFHSGPLKVDLARAYLLSAPFIAGEASVKDVSGEAFVNSMSLKLAGPANNGSFEVAGLGLRLPHIRIVQKKGDVTLDNAELLIEKGEAPLAVGIPARLNANMLWSVRRTAVSGAGPLVVQGARGTFVLAVADLNLKSASPRKITANAEMTQTFDFDKYSDGTRLSIEKGHEQLRIIAKAQENGEIEAAVPDFAIAAASLQSTQAGKRFATPLSAALNATGIRIPADKNGKTTFQRAAATASAGDVLRFAAEAALSGVSPQKITTTGSVNLDLRRAILSAAPFVPSGLKADGAASATWDLSMPLTEKSRAAETNPLRSARGALSQFDKLDFSIRLDNVSASVPSGKGAIVITGLRTGPDLRFVSAMRGESAMLDGGIRFAGVSGLPGSAGSLPSQRGSFALSGELSGWRELRLREEFRIDPLALAHEAELNVSRIDSLLDEKQPFNAATLIKRLDATLFATVDGAFQREMRQLLPGIDVSGNISGNARVDLSAARELSLRCSVNSRDFGVQLANGVKVEGLRSDVSINRAYALAASQGERWTPLSSAMVRPEAVASANSGAAEIVGRIHDDLRGDVSGARTFTIRKVTAKASGVPLVLTSLEGDLLFDQEKSGISFFQTDLLGGTLLASGVFDLRPEVPAVTSSSSFSNLDITHLLPKDARMGSAGRNAEITGEVSITAPLTAEQRELFEQLRFALNIRRIGADTIERALFSLDPYERNEQVVAQRKMLRMGGLKGLRANAVDGAFGMEGEAYIKGVAVELPKVERLRISELPLRQELAKNRGSITALRHFLDLMRADTLIVGTKGELSLKRRIYEK